MTDKPKQDGPSPSKRFFDMAREVETDEAPDAFDRAFKKVIKPSDPKAASDSQ
jgi:hypothetical protein